MQEVSLVRLNRAALQARRRRRDDNTYGFNVKIITLSV